MLNRRSFLKGCAGYAAVAAAQSMGLTHLAFGPHPALTAGPERDLLVFVFVRGGMDGLNLVVPFNTSSADSASYYSTLRPSLSIPAPSSSAPRKSLDLDGRFALHPDAARGGSGAQAPNPTDSDTGGLFKLFQDGDLAIVDATGIPEGTGSHFDTQHFMDMGGAGLNTGWITRYLQVAAETSPLVITPASANSPSLAGYGGAIAIPDADAYGATWLKGSRGDEAIVAEQDALLRSLYTGSSYVDAQGRNAFATFDLLQPALATPYTPAVPYLFEQTHVPDGGQFGRSLAIVAQLAKAPELAATPLRLATIDVGGGWDTHDNQGTVDWDGNDRYPKLITNLANNLKAFHDDLSADPVWRGRFTVIVVSEFGRVLYENRSAGCDHGAGNVMLVLGSGGNVNGGQVYGNWPGLQTLGKNDGLPITTDYRQVLADALYARMSVTADQINGAIFPNLGFTAPLGYTVPRSTTGLFRMPLPQIGK
jgi:uncharacterized protein (DUF1501 family)